MDPHRDVRVLRAGSPRPQHAEVSLVEEIHDQDAARTFLALMVQNNNNYFTGPTEKTSGRFKK